MPPEEIDRPKVTIDRTIDTEKILQKAYVLIEWIKSKNKRQNLGPLAFRFNGKDISLDEIIKEVEASNAPVYWIDFSYEKLLKAENSFTQSIGTFLESERKRELGDDSVLITEAGAYDDMEFLQTEAGIQDLLNPSYDQVLLKISDFLNACIFFALNNVNSIAESKALKDYKMGPNFVNFQADEENEDTFNVEKAYEVIKDKPEGNESDIIEMCCGDETDEGLNLFLCYNISENRNVRPIGMVFPAKIHVNPLTSEVGYNNIRVMANDKNLFIAMLLVLSMGRIFLSMEDYMPGMEKDERETIGSLI